jgi:hypothetical protein
MFFFSFWVCRELVVELKEKTKGEEELRCECESRHHLRDASLLRSGKRGRGGEERRGRDFSTSLPPQ